MSLNRDLESLGKEELEQEKLRVEIRETASRAEWDRKKAAAEVESLSRPEYLKPSFYAALAPSALGVMGLVFSWQSGYFDVKQDELSAQKTLLEYETKVLRDSQEVLEQQVEAFERERDGLKQELDSIRNERDRLDADLAMVTEATGVRVEDLYQGPKIDGVILEVRSNDLVILNVGEVDGVLPGWTFDVYADKTYKGRVRVTRVSEAASVAVVEMLAQEQAVTKGDSATTKL